ncbi:MAG: hypothetical protein FWD84_06570, partial [Oscillospiraceae bacterium]|nr:hypothetical protein [Oscillospiraceae bacterium]
WRSNQLNYWAASLGTATPLRFRPKGMVENFAMSLFRSLFRFEPAKGAGLQIGKGQGLLY